MKQYKLFVALLACASLFTACDDQFTAEDDNHSTEARLLKDPYYAEGLLTYAYTLVPTYSLKFDEVGTDDAVTNVSTNSYLKIATGGWTSTNDPESIWSNGYKAIMNVNEFLNIVDQVSWNSTDESKKKAYAQRLTGEAYAIRGLMKYYLLRNHGGEGEDGQMYGTPIWDTFITDVNAFSDPRASFTEGVASANADFKKALEMLPETFGEKTAVPSNYSAYSLDTYNDVCGDQARQRMDGRTVKAYMTRLTLLAASPAFNKNNDATLWETAAKTAGDLLTENGGISGIDPKGNLWYLLANVTDSDLSSGDHTDTKEIIWRRPIQTINTYESNNYPPTQYGKGQVNPTQNFVDAFPMTNGYPITDANSGYNDQKPYTNRDPRLAQIVVYDKSKVRSATINILTGTSDDATDKKATSTRTGYYLRKLLQEGVNMTTGKTTTANHIIVHVRFTEMYLSYAEAANEAWGPDGKGSYDFSARDVIAAIRKRGGITNDKYLPTITTKEEMRQLIRNERRIELSFESMRFWDLRRWNADLTETAKGIRINNGKYETFDVEDRAYESYMIYGPVPNTEITKFHYTQNKGWN